MTISRVQPGVPAGGQFAATLHPEADVALASAYGLTVHPSAAGPLAYDLAQEGGLTGSITAYEGNNPDVPAGALTYRHPQSNHDLVINMTDGEFGVSYDDRYDEGNSFSTGTHSKDAKDRADLVKSVLFDLDVANTADGTFGYGEAYERRAADFGPSGTSADFIVSANEEDDEGQIAFYSISHDYSTGTTSVFDDSARKNLKGDELAAKVEEISLDLSGGDHSQPSLKDRFDMLLTESAKSPFAPESVRATAEARTNQEA